MLINNALYCFYCHLSFKKIFLKNVLMWLWKNLNIWLSCFELITWSHFFQISTGELLYQPLQSHAILQLFASWNADLLDISVNGPCRWMTCHAECRACPYSEARKQTVNMKHYLLTMLIAYTLVIQASTKRFWQFSCYTFFVSFSKNINDKQTMRRWAGWERKKQKNVQSKRWIRGKKRTMRLFEPTFISLELTPTNRI